MRIAFAGIDQKTTIHSKEIILDKLGKWKITVIESGYFGLDGGAMMGSVPKVLWEKTNPADDSNRIRLALRCLLLDNGQNRVLIETGMGSKITDKTRDMFDVNQPKHPLREKLAEAGYSPDDITHVVNSHLHFDHCGGNTEFGKDGNIVPAFPNAVYCISEQNWGAALNPNPRDRASYLKENYMPLEEHKMLKLIPEYSEIVPEISTIPANGHTPGQQLIKISGNGETMLFCGDLVPLRSHLNLPWIMGYDLNAQLTLNEKNILLNEAAENSWWLFFTHDPETVMVKIKKGKKYFEVTEEVLIKNHSQDLIKKNLH